MTTSKYYNSTFVEDVLRQLINDAMDALFEDMAIKEMMESFQPVTTWHKVLGVAPGCRDIDIVKAAYRAKAKIYHPDVKGTGDAARFRDIVKAMNQAKQELEPCPVNS